MVRGKFKRQKKIDFPWKKGFQYFLVEMLHVAEVKAIEIEQENTMKIHINNNNHTLKKNQSIDLMTSYLKDICVIEFKIQTKKFMAY